MGYRIPSPHLNPYRRRPRRPTEVRFAHRNQGGTCGPLRPESGMRYQIHPCEHQRRPPTPIARRPRPTAARRSRVRTGPAKPASNSRPRESAWASFAWRQGSALRRRRSRTRCGWACARASVGVPSAGGLAVQALKSSRTSMSACRRVGAVTQLSLAEMSRWFRSVGAAGGTCFHGAQSGRLPSPELARRADVFSLPSRRNRTEEA